MSYLNFIYHNSVQTISHWVIIIFVSVQLSPTDLNFTLCYFEVLLFFYFGFVLLKFCCCFLKFIFIYLFLFCDFDDLSF